MVDAGALGRMVCDSATTFGAGDVGAVRLAASHAGRYAAHLCASAGLRAAILHDAGVGRDGAGVAGLDLADGFGMACAALDFRSCRIGDGADGLARGVVSHVNRIARDLGVRSGQPAAEALRRLDALAPRPPVRPEPPTEARERLPGYPHPVWALDSNGLVGPGDVGAVIATGSHGGLLGGRAATAVKQAVFAALYNDAGIGMDEAGVSRLPALDARGIAGATVAAMSARIGEGRSTAADGILSRVNEAAARLGLREGMGAPEALAILAAAAAR